MAKTINTFVGRATCPYCGQHVDVDNEGRYTGHNDIYPLRRCEGSRRFVGDMSTKRLKSKQTNA